MEIELMSESIRRASLLDDIAAIVEESGDAVVPDSLPDIIRIVETAADIEIANKELKAGVFMLTGNQGSALYVPETGTGSYARFRFRSRFHVFDVSNTKQRSGYRVNAELISAAAGAQPAENHGKSRGKA